MFVRIWSRPLGRVVIGAAVLTGFYVTAARAGFPHPDIPPPPFQKPPTGISPEPPVIVPPPIHAPPTPPVHSAPEPGTLVLGLIGAGLAGVAARRRRGRGAVAG
jgi:hypothetical protein